jgi:phosphoglycolate phosphatase
VRDRKFSPEEISALILKKLKADAERAVSESVNNGSSPMRGTNKSQRFTHPLTQAMPLFVTAGAVVSGDTTPHPKPHPEPLFEAARRMAVDPQHCVYVGDDERDIVAGHAAGMHTVAATYGYLGSQGDVKSWNAHLEIDFPMQLLKSLA